MEPILDGKITLDPGPEPQRLNRRIDAVKVGNQVFPIDQIIKWIETRLHTFYVTVAGRQVTVVVRQHAHNFRKSLNTEADSFPPNNLLKLPNC